MADSIQKDEEPRTEQEPFAVYFRELGGRGDPMAYLNGIPAYLQRTKTLRPRAGEEWYVQIVHTHIAKDSNDSSFIILKPVRLVQ